MTKRSVPEIEIVDDETLITRTRWNDRWLPEFQILVPARDRHWSRDLKEWEVYGSRYFDAVIALTRRHFPTVKIVDSRRPASYERSIATLDQDYAQLGLLPIAKPKIVRLVYRELAKEIHPDHGGSHEAMLALNASYERLQQAGAA